MLDFARFAIPTPSHSNPVIAVVCAALAAALLAGCATPGGGRTSAQGPAAEPLPADPNALVLGAEVALQRGNNLEACRAYVQAAQLAKDVDLAEQATRVSYEHHQWSLVLAAAQRWLELNQTDEEARRFAAFAALHLYRIDQAVEHVEFLLNTAFINPQAGFLAILPQLAEEGSASATTAVLERLVLKYPDLTEAHYALARAALQSENFALALQHAQQAHQLGPYWTPVGLLLAQVRMARGDTDEALASARQIVETDRQDSYRLEYAIMLMTAGKEEEARKELNALARSDTVAAVVERLLADLDFQHGNRDAATKRYGSLVANGRFVYESLFNLGAIAESREAWDEAVQLYSRITGGDMAMAAQMRVARIKTKRQGIEAGLTHLEEFAKTRPQYTIDAINARAGLMAANDDKTGALTLLDTALQEYPDAADLRFARVFQLEDNGRIDEALTDLRKLVADRPGDPNAANALGYTLVDHTRKQAEGLKLIEQALQAMPDSGAVLDSMGWALHRAKRNEEALNYLQQAKRRISDPEVDLHLGAVLIALGRKDEARELLKLASERYPDNTELQKQLQSLPK